MIKKLLLLVYHIIKKVFRKLYGLQRIQIKFLEFLAIKLLAPQLMNGCPVVIQVFMIKF